jgi:hypothetical protein
VTEMIAFVIGIGSDLKTVGEIRGTMVIARARAAR